MTETSGQVDSGGVPLHYTARLGGTGRPVLALHGLASTAAGTWQVSGWWSALTAAGLGWVSPDLRGHGSSGKPHDADSYRLPALAADAVAVLDHLGLAVVDVVGYSLGARIALELAATAPDRVRRLALGGLGDPARPVGALPGILDRLPAGADRAAVEACLAGASAGGDGEAPGRSVDGVRAPVLLVAGEHDEHAAGMEAFAARLATAEARRVPGRNHLTTVSAQLFKQAVVEFLTAP